ncbi:hypothetical protein MASR1M32_39190 [Rhodobacter sp.]
MSDTFKFTPLHLGTPLDNLSAAISIIQTQILASDTRLIPTAMFGDFHFTTGQLEAAVALLVGLIEPLDGIRWEEDGK